MVDVPVPGLASIAGGKFTTYRLMARDVVDAAVTDCDRPVPASVTDKVCRFSARTGSPGVEAAAGRIAEDYGVSPATVEHLLGRYGSLATQVLDLTRTDPRLARPVTQGHLYLAAEAAYAVTHEGALHLDDVLVRRMRLFIESADSGTEAAETVTPIMARLLGWNRRRRATETPAYTDLVAAEQAVLSDGLRSARREALVASATAG